MKVQAVLALLVVGVAVEVAHCRRSFPTWDFHRSGREPEYDREVKPNQVRSLQYINVLWQTMPLGT